MLPMSSVSFGPSLLLTDLENHQLTTRRMHDQTAYPAKKAIVANVEYSAVLAFELVCESICPPAPRPFSALNNPGPMKQTKPSMETCVAVVGRCQNPDSYNLPA